MVRLKIDDGNSVRSLEVDTSVYMDEDDALKEGWKTDCIFISHYQLNKHPHSISKPKEFEDNPPSSLEEITPPKPENDWPYDEKILPLVRALTGLGLETCGSCQGHLNHETWHPFPWVNTYNALLSEELRELIGHYNEFSDVEWRIQDVTAVRPLKRPTSKEELESMQNNSQDLAQFLFHSFYD